MPTHGHVQRKQAGAGGCPRAHLFTELLHWVLMVYSRGWILLVRSLLTAGHYAAWTECVRIKG